MTMATTYYVIEGPKDLLAKVVDQRTGFLYRDGAWVEDAWALERCSGIGGDADAREITAAEAKKLTSR